MDVLVKVFFIFFYLLAGPLVQLLVLKQKLSFPDRTCELLKEEKQLMVGHFLIVSLIVCSENKVGSKRGGIELFIFCQSLAVCFVFLFLFEVFLFALRFII